MTLFFDPRLEIWGELARRFGGWLQTSRPEVTMWELWQGGMWSAPRARYVETWVSREWFEVES